MTMEPLPGKRVKPNSKPTKFDGRTGELNDSPSGSARSVSLLTVDGKHSIFFSNQPILVAWC
jgi:hypothetical protein